jgi:hypothetical protein
LEARLLRQHRVCADSRGSKLDSFIERHWLGIHTLGYAIVLPVPGPGFRDRSWTDFGRKPTANGPDAILHNLKDASLAPLYE